MQTAIWRCGTDEITTKCALEDLDFTLTRPISLEEILARLIEIFAASEAACGLRIAFDREDRHGHQNSHTFYLHIKAHCPPRTT
jgi:hypothetical protein